MNYETILLERRENVGVIKLNHPQKRNALGSQLIGELIDGLQEFKVAARSGVILSFR